MKKLLFAIVAAGLSLSIGTRAEVFEAKPVKGGACWRNGLSRTGVNDTKGVPAKTGENWRVKIGGKVVSSPVVFDGLLYVGSDKGFYALDAKSGTETWSLPIKKGGVLSSACIADGYVYFNGMDGRLYSVEAKTGTIKWKVFPKGLYKKPVTISPAVAYGLVFSKGASGIAGFDVETGKEVYQSAIAPPPGTGICMNDKYFFSLSAAGTGIGRGSIETGLRVQGFKTSLSYCRATPAISNDKLFGASVALIGTMVAYPRIAIMPLDLKKRPVSDYIQADKKAQDRKASFASPTPWDGKVFLGCDSGFLYAFDEKNAKRLWGFEVGSPVRASASVSAQDGIVYVPAYDGKLYAVDGKSGEKKWEHKISQPVKDPTEINSCPWVQDGVVYIGTVDGEIIAIH